MATTSTKPKPRAKQTIRQRELRTAGNVAQRTARARYEARATAEERITAARTAGRIEASQETERARTRGYFTRHIGTKALGAAGSASKPVVNPVFLIIGTMAVLIIIYDLVTHAQGTSQLSNSAANAVSKLSTTSPLFVKTKTS